jgi:hypothetical protein
MAYAPPEGSPFIAAGARAGILQVDAVHVSVDARDEEPILAAARTPDRCRTEFHDPVATAVGTFPARRWDADGD